MFDPVDVRSVHFFVEATGRSSRKVFKLGRIVLAPGARQALQTSISLQLHTTRKPQPGAHRVEVLVNGSALPAGSFVVLPSSPARR